MSVKIRGKRKSCLSGIDTTSVNIGDCGNIVIFAIFAKFSSIANFYGRPHCFVLCPGGDCSKIVIFAMFAKFASIANFYGPPIALCFALLAIVAKLSFRNICQIRQHVLFFAIFVVACISGHMSKIWSNYVERVHARFGQFNFPFFSTIIEKSYFVYIRVCCLFLNWQYNVTWTKQRKYPPSFLF